MIWDRTLDAGLDAGEPYVDAIHAAIDAQDVAEQIGDVRFQAADAQLQFAQILLDQRDVRPDGAQMVEDEVFEGLGHCGIGPDRPRAVDRPFG